MSIANNLRKIRKDSMMSQVQLSEMSGVSQSQISSIESGQRNNPGICTMKKLARSLEVTVEQLTKSE